MAQVEVHHHPSAQVIAFETTSVLAAANEEGITLILDHDAAIVRIKLTWAEQDLILTAAVDRYMGRNPTEGHRHG